MNEALYRAVPLVFERLGPLEQRARLHEFHARLTRRRSVRHFLQRPGAR